MTAEFEILLVEDEQTQRRIIQDILVQEGYSVRGAASGEAAMELIEERLPDLVVSDWKMPGMDGGELLKVLRRRELAVGFIVMTAYGTIAHAMEAIHLGADDYLAKPFEREELLLAVKRMQRTTRLERENRRLREEIGEREGFGEIFGRSETMRQLYRSIKKVAVSDATVLVTGESGTGKELVARTIHEQSRRAAGPFVAVNCAAIPETLIESELFGHERGAFTGADRRREGKFEEAQGGTLFLDEIASMPLPLQAVLLRVIQERKTTRLGGKGEISLDVRLLAATNKDLGELVARQAFREDLFYRLNVVPLKLPPLRERREDIPLLAAVFRDRLAERHQIQVESIPPVILRKIMEYSWPGNVRELANVIERLVLLSEEGRLKFEDLPEEMRRPTLASSCPFHLPANGVNWEEMESGLLRQALDYCEDNKTKAAKLVGLSYKTFLYRLEKYGL